MLQMTSIVYLVTIPMRPNGFLIKVILSHTLNKYVCIEFKWIINFVMISIGTQINIELNWVMGHNINKCPWSSEVNILMSDSSSNMTITLTWFGGLWQSNTCVRNLYIYIVCVLICKKCIYMYIHSICVYVWSMDYLCKY